MHNLLPISVIFVNVKIIAGGIRNDVCSVVRAFNNQHYNASMSNAIFYNSHRMEQIFDFYP